MIGKSGVFGFYVVSGNLGMFGTSDVSGFRLECLEFLHWTPGMSGSPGMPGIRGIICNPGIEFLESSEFMEW